MLQKASNAKAIDSQNSNIVKKLGPQGRAQELKHTFTKRKAKKLRSDLIHSEDKIDKGAIHSSGSKLTKDERMLRPRQKLRNGISQAFYPWESAKTGAN